LEKPDTPVYLLSLVAKAGHWSQGGLGFATSGGDLGLVDCSLKNSLDYGFSGEGDFDDFDVYEGCAP
jgi:hypothetical protein